jgi:hypothetical protein
MIRRLSSAAARRVSNIFTGHGPDFQQIGTTLEKVREWRDADDVELEDVLVSFFTSLHQLKIADTCSTA